MHNRHIKIKNNTLVIATHNRGKWKEFREMFQNADINILSAADLNLDEPEETGTTFDENAKLKAVIAAQKSGYTALADDSGLAIDALNGEPGIFSARWAGIDKNFNRAMNTIKQKLNTQIYHKPSAQFICVLCLATPQGAYDTFTGTATGYLTWPPKGTNGFGYDPIFIPDGYTRTFGEMLPQEKNPLSHRTHAFKQMIKTHFFKKTYDTPSRLSR